MKLLDSIRKSSFIKNALLLTGATASAQLLVILTSPIITRIYTPGEYGVLTVYNSILAILVIIASLKFEWAIPISDDDERAVNVLGLSFLVLITFVCTITVILTIVGDQFLSLFSGEELLNYKYLIPLGIFVAGAYNILTQWALRKKSFKSLSKTKLSQSIGQNIIKILLGLLNFGSKGLLLGSIFGQGAGLTTLSRELVKNDRHLFKKININKIKWCARRYIKFPIYTATSQLLNTGGLQLPSLFITSLYGSATVGYYGLATVIVNMPMNLIGISVADVFYSEAATLGKNNPEKIKILFNKLNKRLILIGILPFVILLLLGPYLFSIVFGEEWYEAGIYSRIIALMVFARFIFTPISKVFSIFEKQRTELFLDIFRVTLVLISFGITMFLSLDSYMFVGIYALAMTIVYLITFIVAKKMINNAIEDNEKNIV